MVRWDSWVPRHLVFCMALQNVSANACGISDLSTVTSFDGALALSASTACTFSDANAFAQASHSPSSQNDFLESGYCMTPLVVFLMATLS